MRTLWHLCAVPLCASVFLTGVSHAADTDTAVASCKKHVESMLKESADTTFSSGPELRVQPADGGSYDVSGWVKSRASSGETRRADFNCHASRFGGGLWTTKTSLSFDR
jgi:hypothetical protein